MGALCFPYFNVWRRLLTTYHRHFYPSFAASDTGYLLLALPVTLLCSVLYLSNSVFSVTIRVAAQI